MAIIDMTIVSGKLEIHLIVINDQLLCLHSPLHPPVNKFRQQSPLLAFEMCFDLSSTSLQLRLLFCTPLQSLGAKGGARTLGGPLKEGCQVQWDLPNSTMLHRPGA